ncbi:hypothetical protein ACIQU6_43355, partial [Streptomyces sp. NPDC090442]
MLITPPTPADDPPPTPYAPLPGPERHRGHLRMAERFLAEHADHLRHVHGVGWFRWDGARWAPDEQRADIEAAVTTVKTALADLNRLTG